MSSDHKSAQADLETLFKIFTVPEAPDSTLGQIDQHISQNLVGFLQDHIVAIEKDLGELEHDFSDSDIPDDPIFVSEQAEFLLKKLVAHSVHTSAPSFIGHMTSALPYFMLPLSKIMMALNQNLVKIETSKAFTPMERQVIGMLHKLIYDQNDAYYKKWMHNSEQSLGSFCSGGTIANITALWAARNNLFQPEGDFRGVAREGLFRGLKHKGWDGIAILCSERGHYSLGKAVDLLGIGRDDLIPIATDDHNKVKVSDMEKKIKALQKENIKPFALIGVAGTSETGTVDPLDDIAELAEQYDCHFHVDAAWGGPTLFSEKYKHVLKGIERADSVTIDAHKQLYVPMGAGICVFKDPKTLTSIEHHAEYIIRKGSKDLGSHTLEGSRPGMAMLVHSGLKVIGRKGYQLLVDQGIEKARKFAKMIESDPEFELVTSPELNILTYRYIPPEIRDIVDQNDPEQMAHLNPLLNKLTKRLQKTQRARGQSFVSRTQLNPARYGREPVIVFRVVLANPLTTLGILENILAEQKEIARGENVQAFLGEIREYAQACTAN